MSLAEQLDLAERVGRLRDDCRMVEYLADDLFDDELDLRIDAARLSILDVACRVEELILEGGGEPDLEAVEA